MYILHTSNNIILGFQSLRKVETFDIIHMDGDRGIETASKYDLFNRMPHEAGRNILKLLPTL